MSMRVAGVAQVEAVASLSDQLRHAALAGDIELVRSLIAAGANPNFMHYTDARSLPDSNPGKTALHYAAAHGREEVVALLLSWGANPNARRLHGDTPLMEWVRGCACTGSEASVPRRDYHRVAVLLLAAGADPHLAHDSAAGSAWTAASAKGVLPQLVLAQAEVGANQQAQCLGLATVSIPAHKDDIRRL